MNNLLLIALNCALQTHSRTERNEQNNKTECTQTVILIFIRGYRLVLRERESAVLLSSLLFEQW